jgi:hypothetical protein
VIGQVSEGDLHPDPLGAEAAGIAYQAADGNAGGGQPPQQRQPNGSCRTCQQQHPAEPTEASPP